MFRGLGFRVLGRRVQGLGFTASEKEGNLLEDVIKLGCLSSLLFRRRPTCARACEIQGNSAFEKACSRPSSSETLGLYLGSLYESCYLGVIGPWFLNQVPTLVEEALKISCLWCCRCSCNCSSVSSCSRCRCCFGKE